MTVRVAIAVLVLVVVVRVLAAVRRVPMVRRPMAATSLPSRLTPPVPSVFARPLWPKRKENKHVAT
jgi:hypothetical protein